jgi:coenzyme F420-reducing hydrogenase beta subunit
LIDIRLNKDGFYEPYIAEPQKCTDCGLCVEVCSYSHNDYALRKSSLTSYAAWSKEPAVRKKCSSGGVGFEVGRYLISQGYLVLGCRYNTEVNRAEHYVASTIEELIPSIGSKYIQSYTVDGLKQIDRKKKYLVTGTPCQIDSFRRYIQKFRCEDNFILMDFFCHGVPSMLMWKQYRKLVEKKLGKLTYVSWRDKTYGWHDSWAMIIDGEKNINHSSHSGNELMSENKGLFCSRLSQGDIFYKLFLGDFCMNPACRNTCRFKYDKSSADIRIGDLWGKTYKNNEDGVSAVVAFTNRGYSIIDKLNCQLISHSFEEVAEGQMKKNAKSAVLSFVAMKMLRSDKYFSEKDWRWLFFMESIFHIPFRLKCKIKNVLKSK